MRRRSSLVSLAAFSMVTVRLATAAAQLDLPPPPPPPIGEPSEVPSLPPPPSPAAPDTTTSSGSKPSRRFAPGAPLSRTRRRVALPAEAARPSRDASAPPPSRPIAITWSPLGLFWGRLSGSVEVGLVPHHSVAASPNVLVFEADRGSSRALLARGFGFATTASAGFGVELGYHYWFEASRVLRGPFVGPSFLFGGTSRAGVGDPSRVEGYWGLAVDAGTQEVLVGGFTAGVGAGVGLLQMAGVTTIFPRFLVSAGWSL